MQHRARFFGPSARTVDHGPATTTAPWQFVVRNAYVAQRTPTITSCHHCVHYVGRATCACAKAAQFVNGPTIFRNITSTQHMLFVMLVVHYPPTVVNKACPVPKHNHLVSAHLLQRPEWVPVLHQQLNVQHAGNNTVFVEVLWRGPAIAIRPRNMGALHKTGDIH